MIRVAFINPRVSTLNVGDLFIEDAVKRILSFDQAESHDFDPRKPLTPDLIRQLNACDVAVIVGTNLWYREIHRPGGWCWTTEDLKRIKIPIVPMGVGTTRHVGEDNGFTADSLRLLKEIHDRCEVSSVRDERTLCALREAGVRNVQLTGCPTLFRSLQPTWQLETQSEQKTVTVTVRKRQRGNVRRLIQVLQSQGYNVVIAAQVRSDLHAYHSWRTGPTTLYQFDLQRYLDLAVQSAGAIGCRLHGNMLQLAHRKRAAFVANCSRADSFCRTFALPRVFCPDREALRPSEILNLVEQFFDDAQYVPFAQRYAMYFQEMAQFLESNRLPHRMTSEMAASTLPAVTRTNAGPTELRLWPSPDSAAARGAGHSQAAADGLKDKPAIKRTNAA